MACYEYKGVKYTEEDLVKLLQSQQLKTRRILELQSDLFQKGRGKENLVQENIDVIDKSESYTYDGWYYSLKRHPFSVIKYKIGEDGEINFAWKQFISEEEFRKNDPRRNIKESNQFLQLLNKDDNWVTFFIKSIIQDSAKKGYEKVLFPTGETAALIEGFIEKTENNDKLQVVSLERSIENAKKEPYKRQGEYQSRKIDGKIRKVIVVAFKDSTEDIITASSAEEAEQKLKDNHEKYLKRNLKIIDVFQDKLNKLIEKINKPDYNPYTTRAIIDQNSKENLGTTQFYQTKVKNILNKVYGKENVKTITDEYGNQWYELSINQARDLQNVMLQRNEANQIIGQANIKAMTVLVDAVNKKEDTIPHEYAHHYIAWFRDTPIVQEGIKRFGSEEALVQAIGEQVVKQKGEAYNWWKKFTNWLLNLLSDKQLLQILTDSFLNRQNLNDFTYNNVGTEQIKKFTELQERLNNKEFIEGAKNAFESSEELQQFGTQEKYNNYIARVSLGIIKNPSSGEYNYESKVKDIVYHGVVKGREAYNNILQKGFDFKSKRNWDTTKSSFKEDDNTGMFFSDRTTGQSYGMELTYKVNEKGEYEDVAYDNTIPVILNIKNLDTSKTTSSGSAAKFYRENKNKSLIGMYGLEGGSEGEHFNYVVFEPEQIHVLASKLDIKGFKDFMAFENSEFSKYGTYQQFRDFIISKSSMEIENKLIEIGKIDRVC